MQSAAWLAVPYQRCWPPKGQTPASASCRSPCCPTPSFLRYFSNGERWFGCCCYYGSLPYDLPCVAFSSGVLVSCLRWLRQQLFQQQATTTTHSRRRVLAGGLLLSGDDVCHGWGVCDILVCLACSSPRQHLTCVLIIACITIVSSTQQSVKSAVKIGSVYRRGQVRFEICVTHRRA